MDSMQRKNLVGERILLTLWVGGMWTVGYVVAPVLFNVLDDRRLAGTLAGHMFSAISYIGIACGFLLLAGSLFEHGRALLRKWRTWILIAMLLLILAAEYILQPVMAELRATGLPGGSPEAQRFGLLHGMASIMFLVTSLLGLVLVIWPRPGD